MAQKKDLKTNKWMYYGSYVDDKGTRIQYKKRGFDTRKKAIRAELSFRDSVENKDAYMTFRDACNEYLKLSTKELKESSYVDTIGVLNKISKSIGDIKLSKLSSDVLQKYIDELDQKYAKLYVEKLYYRINKVLNFAVHHEYISVNPMRKVKRDARKNEVRKEMLFWEPAEFEYFLKFVDNQMYKTAFSFLYYMGVRRGEAMALQWSDINLQTKTVKINKTFNTKLNKITSPKTPNSIRSISIPIKLSQMLSDWKEHEQKLYEFGESIFVFGYTRPIPAETLRRYFNQYMKTANEKLNDSEKIPVIRIHDLRHSHASYLINNMSAGFTDFDIAKRLGDTVSTLHSTYAHWFKSADKNIIDFMDSDI